MKLIDANIRTFGIIIEGTGSSKEEAWSSFVFYFKTYCTWLKGYKYWRLSPEDRIESNFASAEIEYKVVARITITDHPIEKAKEAIFEYSGFVYNWKDYINTVRGIE